MAVINLGVVAYSNKGPYNSETTYEKYDVVLYNNGSYVYINDNMSAGKTPTDTTYWQAMLDPTDMNAATAAANEAAESVEGFKQEISEEVSQLSEELGDNWQHFYGKLSQINGYDTVIGGWGFGGTAYYHMINTWTDLRVSTLPSLLKILAYPAIVTVMEGFQLGASLYDANGNYVRNISATKRLVVEVFDESIKYIGLNIFNDPGIDRQGVPLTAEECGLKVKNATPAVFSSDISNLLYDAVWDKGYIVNSGNYDTISPGSGKNIHSDYIDVSALQNIVISVADGFGGRIFMLNENKVAIGSTTKLNTTIVPADKVKYIRFNLEIVESIGKQIPISYKYKIAAKSYVYSNETSVGKETEYDITMRYSEDLKNALAAQRDLTSTVANNDSNVRLPSFVHVTDVHGDGECFRNACEIAKHLSATALVNTGDTVFYYSGDDTSFVADAVSENGINYLVSVGNHDTFQYTEEQAHDKHISPFASSQGYVFVSDNAKLTYYYKDFADKKLRVLSINQFQYSASSAATIMHFTQEQIDFICASLLSTPQDYGVIIIMHAPEMRPVASAGYDKFFQKKMIWFNTGNAISPISEIVDAFISGTAINKTYNNKSGTTPESFTVNADFSGKNTGVEFICYCTGHAHADSVHYLSNTTNKQLMLNATCTCSYSNKNKDGTEGDGNAYLTELSDLPRVDGTSTKDSFNVYCIDRGNKSVKVVRIGSNMPYALSEKRDFMVIPYKE